MRELKFRAWDKKDKFFIDNGALQFGADGKIYYINAGLEYGEPVLEREDITDEVIVEQYTGLKDKNGKEIYEGDIINCWGKFVSCVTFDDFLTAFVWLSDDGDGYHILSKQEDAWEVIGNIHENLELLEGK